jgi:uncharacterized membrane protein YfcA
VGPDPDLWIWLLSLLLAGAAAGFSGGLFGIGGGFVVVPALLLILPMVGTAPEHLVHVAVGTSLCTIIFTSLRAASAHFSRGAVDLPLLRSWGPWVVAGTVVGSLLADALASSTLALIFGIGVLCFAALFLIPGMAGKRLASTMPTGVARAALASALGTVSTMLGIGGGTIATITMTLCGASIHRAIGTASGIGAIIALPGTLGFLLTGLDEPGLPPGSLGYVNLPAALTIVVTSTLCAPLGVAMAHRLNASRLRAVFGAYLLVVGVNMIGKA